jgi:hypothetical protein
VAFASDLRQFARDEQATLWHELDDAISASLNGAWSIGCANIAARIVRAARLVGVTHWQAVPTTLAFGGVYAALVEMAGLSAETPRDEEIVALLAEWGAGRPGGILDLTALRRQHEPTVRAMREPREAAFICEP